VEGTAGDRTGPRRTALGRARQALSEGIRASGVDVAEIGMFATPIAFSRHELGCGSAVGGHGQPQPARVQRIEMVLAGTTLAGEDVSNWRRRSSRASSPAARAASPRRDPRGLLNRITSDVAACASMKIAVDCGNASPEHGGRALPADSVAKCWRLLRGSTAAFQSPPRSSTRRT